MNDLPKIPLIESINKRVLKVFLVSLLVIYAPFHNQQPVGNNKLPCGFLTLPEQDDILQNITKGLRRCFSIRSVIYSRNTTQNKDQSGTIEITLTPGFKIDFTEAKPKLEEISKRALSGQYKFTTHIYQDTDQVKIVIEVKKNKHTSHTTKLSLSK